MKILKYILNILENYIGLYYSGDRKKETIWFAFLSSRTYLEAYTILLDLYDEKKKEETIKNMLKKK